VTPAQRLEQTWQRVQAADEGIPSPCVSVCTMDAETGWCDGCLRSLPEIAHWSVLSDAEKKALWPVLVERAKMCPG